MEPVRYFLWEVCAGFAVPSVALPPASFCRPPRGALCASTCDAGFFLLGFLLGSRRGAAHISVMLVKFLTVPPNRQIKVLYHGIESISR